MSSTIKTTSALAAFAVVALMAGPAIAGKLNVVQKKALADAKVQQVQAAAASQSVVGTDGSPDVLPVLVSTVGTRGSPDVLPVLDSATSRAAAAAASFATFAAAAADSRADLSALTPSASASTIVGS